jgi:hypothetical protein
VHNKEEVRTGQRKLGMGGEGGPHCLWRRGRMAREGGAHSC